MSVGLSVAEQSENISVSKIAILDPVRATQCLETLRSTHAVAKELVAQGAEVEWYVAVNDTIQESDGIVVHRIFRTDLAEASSINLQYLAQADKEASELKNAGNPASLLSSLAAKPESEESDFLEPKKPEFSERLIAWDRWEQSIQAKPAFPKIIPAVVVYILIRLFYFSQWWLHTITWHIKDKANKSYKFLRRQLFHPLARQLTTFVHGVYWRILHAKILEPTAVLLKSLRWRLLHRGHMATLNIARFIFRRVVRPAHNKVADSFRRLYFKFLFPKAFEPCLTLLRSFRWRLVNPIIDHLITQLRPNWLLSKFSSRLADSSKQSPNLISLKGSANHKPFKSVVEPWLEAMEPLLSQWKQNHQPKALLIPGCTPELLESLLAAVAYGDLTAPLTINAVAMLRHSKPPTTHKADEFKPDLETLKGRWHSGAPFMKLRFITLEASAGDLSYYWTTLQNEETKIESIGSAAGIAKTLLNDFIDEEECQWTCEKFGPLALVVSALWGRVGSTSIFEAQTHFLLSQGYRVARIYLDHWPQTGPHGLNRLTEFMRQDQSVVRPHYSVIMERDDSDRALRRLNKNDSFSNISPVGRLALQLSEATALSPKTLEFLKHQAVVIVANHVQHLILARNLGTVPLILETHDILSELLDAHGIPRFVASKPDSSEQRKMDEVAIWRQADYCVALSPEDHIQIAAVIPKTILVQPKFSKSLPTKRSWPELIEFHKEKKWSENAKECGLFDILLWGSWHENNVNSIIWFLEEVLPLVPNYETVRVGIAGQVIRGLKNKTSLPSWIVLMPEVDNMADLLQRTLVPVISDQEGTGISIKVMDAIALNCSIVASRKSLRGLNLNGLDFNGCITHKEMAKDISTLLLSFQARQERKRVVSEVAARNYSDAQFSERWREIFEALRLPLLPPVKSAKNSIQKATGKSSNSKLKSGVSVIVATFERYDVLPDALKSLQAQNIDPNHLEIIVVDNSRDQERAALNARRYEGDPQVKYLLESRSGVANARNLGVAAANYEIVAFVDDDAMVDPTWAQSIKDSFRVLGDKADVIGGPVMPRFVSERPTWLTTTMLSYLSVIDWPGPARKLQPTEWIAGCNMAFRRQVFSRCGYFNSSLGRNGSGLSLISNEDTEFIERINASGGGVFFQPSMKVEHVIDPRRLNKDWFRRRSAWQGVSEFLKEPAKTVEYASRAAMRIKKDGAICGEILLEDQISESRNYAADDEIGLFYDMAVSLLAASSEANVTISENSKANDIEQDSPQLPALSLDLNTLRKKRAVAVPALTVVIATYNRYDILPLAIESVLKQDLPIGILEIIVVDNSPDQKKAKVFGKSYNDMPSFTYHLEKTPGLSNARNVGVNLAKAPLVAFIDDDALADPQWAASILSAFRKYPGAGAIGGRILPRFSSRRPSWLSDKAVYFLSIIDWGTATVELKSDQWIAGCNMAFRREHLLQIGGFSKDLGRNGSGQVLLSNEESKVVELLTALGLKTIYAGEALVEHIIDSERLSQSWFRRRSAWQAASFFMQDPEKAFTAAMNSMWNVERLSRHRPKGAPIGIFYNPQLPDKFYEEVILCYDLMMVVLAGGGAALRAASENKQLQTSNAKK